MKVLINLDNELDGNYLLNVRDAYSVEDVCQILREDEADVFQKLIKMSKSIMEVPLIDLKKAEACADLTFKDGYSVERLS